MGVPGDIDRLDQMSTREQLQHRLQVACLLLRSVDSDPLENTSMGALYTNILNCTHPVLPASELAT